MSARPPVISAQADAIGDAVNLVDRMRHIHHRLLHALPLREADASMLAAGIGDYLADIDGGRTPSLDRAFGLKASWGGISPAHRDRLLRRDTLLRSLRATTAEWQFRNSVAVAPLMSISARRYEASRWLREREGALPSDEPAATWWRILSHGLKIPGAKRLQQILDEEIQEPFEFPSSH